MRKIAFIINPVAGKGKAIRLIELIKKKICSPEIEVKTFITTRKGEIREQAAIFQREGFREILVAGGDGSLCDLLTGLNLEEEVTVGIIPFGTGNDFVKSLELQDMEEIFNAVLNKRTKKIDIGEVNGIRFSNTCSFGVDSQLDQFLPTFKIFGNGKMSYMGSAITAGLTYQAKKAKIYLDDQYIETKLTLLCVGNGKYFGGGMKICPEAKIDDGYFDVCLIGDIGNLTFLMNFSKVYSGQLHKVKQVKYYKAKKIRIEMEETMPINTDGDLQGETPAQIRILEKAVSIYCK